MLGGGAPISALHGIGRIDSTYTTRMTLFGTAHLDGMRSTAAEAEDAALLLALLTALSFLRGVTRIFLRPLIIRRRFREATTRA